MRFQSSAQLHDLRNGSLVRACGIVTLRQRPATAKGLVFVSLEDEAGAVQILTATLLVNVTHLLGRLTAPSRDFH
jgi:aspartyl-tRNA synthetase